MKDAIRFRKNATVYAIVLTFLLLAAASTSWADEPVLCPMGDNHTLKPLGDNMHYMTNVKVVGVCDVTTDPGQMGPLKYYLHNVNIVKGGQLIFHDDYDIDFYAESILVENGGKLIAVSTQPGYLPKGSLASDVLPYQKRLTIHLWGALTDAGIVCASDMPAGVGPCGIPGTVWTSNPLMAMELMKDMPGPPPLPKNKDCNHTNMLPGNDCFYQYEVQDKADRGTNAFFGHKVLAVSFGGSLQLFGSHSVSYLTNGQKCMPDVPGNECNPAFTGTSWVRLTELTDAMHITVDRAVDWVHNDLLAVTPTDYLPSHAEEVLVDSVSSDGKTITLQSPGLIYDHHAATFSYAAAPDGVGPKNDPNRPDLDREIDTRAAVALLTRNIQVVSEGDVPANTFDQSPTYSYGGHTIIRQGFTSYQVQGVEFYHLGQGGIKGRYPVHFHMVRKTAQPVPTSGDPTPEPLNYLKDCSIHDSMTRWVTLHATQGMYMARNVGEKSIGHGFYLEDASETYNKIYSNIGILARAAIQDPVHNPRQVPGILADNTGGGGDLDFMPYRSDFNHPTVFWITNGWNDFEYNFAAGAATCGACYWWLGTANSGPSQYQTFDDYASQQVVTDNQTTNVKNGGLTPLLKFVGNSCVAAMTSFQTVGQTAACAGVLPTGSTKLSAVKSTAPPGPGDFNAHPFTIYYPVVNEVHNPTFCTFKGTTRDCSSNTPQNDGTKPCDAGDTQGVCAVTHLDHYTTSFNYAETNFAAIWLRKGWDLFTNGAVTDPQSGGLNFTTGGGYTRSDVNAGEWLLARNSVFVGYSQKGGKNAYASDVGPFNAESGLQCDTTAPDHCEYADGGVSFNLPTFPGQKLINIYDGPEHEVNNAFMQIEAATIDDCIVNPNGNCMTSKVPLARQNGILQNKTVSPTTCYLPNAAIGWKQPNGFYYPPAFHSTNLWFSDVDIRHFVVEPLFKPILWNQNDPFQQSDQVSQDYCTYSSDMFSASFTHIDRETVLNDDDGSLTGLVGEVAGGSNETPEPAISINEDPFFSAPLTTPECRSNIDVNPPPLPKGAMPTATTSPYQWLTTAIRADCSNNQCIDPQDPNDTIKWGFPCTDFNCRGVPLYREYLTDKEGLKFRPQIRMMGQANGQRSTLSLNYGAYYIDTTQTCTSQGACPTCNQRDSKTGACTGWNSPFSPSIFEKNHTYYVFLVYANDQTKQKYDIFVGKKHMVGDFRVTPIYMDPNGWVVNPPTDGSFVKTPAYDPNSGLLTVNMDLTGQTQLFTNTKKAYCTPSSYCSAQGGVCGCNPNNPDCDPNANDCKWATSDVDCPVGVNANLMNCFGFSFTLPADFPQGTQLQPPDSLFVSFNDQPDKYFEKGHVQFTQGSKDPMDACYYNPVPTQ